MMIEGRDVVEKGTDYYIPFFSSFFVTKTLRRSNVGIGEMWTEIHRNAIGVF